jgi:glutathione S-transferase
MRHAPPVSTLASSLTAAETSGFEPDLVLGSVNDLVADWRPRWQQLSFAGRRAKIVVRIEALSSHPKRHPREESMADITMWNLGPSPNNMKVRIALNYKGIPFDTVEVAFMDEERAAVVEVSGQPLTPVIKHGDAVVYDSRAILRYLDNNFRDTPSLFATDRPTMMALEQEEDYGRNKIGEPVGMVFGQAIAEDGPDISVCAQASQMIHAATAPYEERLQNQDFLMGDHMTVVDVTAAPLVSYSMVPREAGGPENPLVQCFIDNFSLGDGRDKTREWVGRVMAYDR